MLLTVAGLAAAAIVVVVDVVVDVVDDGDGDGDDDDVDDDDDDDDDDDGDGDGDDKVLKHAPASAQKNWLAFGMLLDSICRRRCARDSVIKELHTDSACKISKKINKHHGMHKNWQRRMWGVRHPTLAAPSGAEEKKLSQSVGLTSFCISQV